MTLKEWLEVHNSIDEIDNIILHLDYALKKEHLSYNCVSDFNPQRIAINSDGVKYDSTYKPSKEEFRSRCDADILTLASLAIGIYLDNTSTLLAPSVISERFNTHVASLLPEDKVDYYRRVFVDNERGYLCDNLVQNIGNESERVNARYLVKSTPTGKLMSVDKGTETGFVSIKVLGILFVIFAIVGVVLYFLLFAE